MCPRRTDPDRRYSAARRPGPWTGTEIHSDKRARSYTPYTADGPASQSVSRGCVPIRAIPNPACKACVVLEFDKDAPPAIALLHSGRQCKDVVEKERRITGRQKSIAKVAMVRNLGFACTGCCGMAVSIYRRWSSGSYAGQLGTGHGTRQNARHLIGHPAS